jgi:16S rRNA G966 N2-methylase RsmD
MDVEDAPRICLLEFDERFEVFEEFVRFDFEKPLLLPGGLEGSFDCLLVDPPYHSEDCVRKCELSCFVFYWERLTDWVVLQLRKQPNGSLRSELHRPRSWFVREKA